jgi:hypothetical protein
MKAKRAFAVLLGLVSLTAGVSTGNAATVVWETIVRVDSVSASGPVPDYLAAVHEGDSLQWSTFIDPSGPSTISDFGTGSVGRHDVIRAWLIEFPLTPLLLEIPEPSSPAASGGIDVHDDLNGYDEINVQANARIGGTDGEYQLFYAGMFFLDLTATGVDSAELPLDPPDLAAFASHTFTLEFQDNDFDQRGFWRAEGEIVIIRRIVSVPEPSTVWLVSVALLGLFGVRRLPRRRQE